MALCVKASDIDVAGSTGCSGRRLGKPPVIALAGSQAPRSPWTKLGMALGYLCLVAILSMAPFVQQTINPQQGQPMLCTDFGGSR